VDDELDAVGDDESDLERSTGLVGPDQHREVVEVEHADRIAVGVKDLLIGDAVLASARDDHRDHDINLS
jgi:hypothetical protein